MSRTKTDDASLHILEGLVTYRLTRVADTLVRAAAQVYRSHHDVSITELRLLATIGHHQPLALNEVSRLAGIDKAWVSRSLALLVARGLVVRSPHPTDNRITLLSLTRPGKAKVRQIIPLAAVRNERLLASMSKARRALLDALLAELQVHAEHLLAHPDGASSRGHAGTARTPSRQRAIGRNGTAANQRSPAASAIRVRERSN